MPDHALDEDYRSGLGIGLQIHRQIIELHGSTIRVECPPDRGIRLVVHLQRRVDGRDE